jgi:HEAT repeat protein
MKIFRQHSVKIVYLVFIFLGYFSCSQVDLEKFEKAVGELQSYQYGDSRAPLSEIEALVTQTTNVAHKKEMAQRLAVLLELDTSFAAKQFICQQLRVIGSEEQLPVLRNLLMEEETTDIAIFALATIQSPKVDEMLRNSLPDLNSNSRPGVINTLGERRDDKSVQVLAPFLSENSRPLAEAAALALGKIGTREAGSEIKKAMDKSTGELQSTLIKNYLMCAQNMVARGNTEDALSIFRDLAEFKDNERIRMAANHSLVVFGQADAVNYVAKAIKSGDRIVRRLAMRTVVETSGKDDTKKFCELVSELPSKYQSLLIMALSDRNDPEALSTIVDYAGSNDQEVKIAALRAIANLGDETVVHLLLEESAGAGHDEVEAARMSLYRSKGSKVDTKIIEMSTNENDNIRLEATKALRVRNVIDATPYLIKLVADKDERIRIESWNGLSELGSEKDLASMISSWIQLSNPTEIQVAEEAVVSVFRNSSSKNLPTADISAAIESEPGMDIQISLINALGRIGDPNSLSQLRDLVKSEDSDIRYAAIRALSLWPTDEPIRDLRQVVETSTIETEKIVALRGYIQLLALELIHEKPGIVSLYNDAMNLAWRSEEKKMVLAGYAQIYHIESLKAVEPYIGDDNLDMEAMAAALNICDRLTEDDLDEEEREIIIRVLKMISENNQVDTMKEEASEILSRLEE